ncbi:MAG: hypothetical protein GVY15_03530 [Bacteroidetes bacterium]|jgi:hypothetical protein|nr:hypothetical protein [Bacteroidota bacterium]
MNASVPRERAFQRLMQRLDYPATACARLRAVCAFIDALPAPLTAHEPYLLELAAVWPALVDDLSPVGDDPRRLHQQYRILTRVGQAVPAVRTLPEVQPALQRLRDHTALAFAQVGAHEQMAAVLHIALPEEKAPGRRRPDVHLRQLAAAATDAATAEVLQRLAQAYSQALLPTGAGCWVPVIEQAPGTAAGCGRLRRLTARLVGPATGTADEVHADVAVFGVGQSRTHAVADAAAAARQRLQQTHPRLGARYQAGAIHFDVPFVPHEGRSAHLAVAAVLYGAFLREAGVREQYTLRPRVALTGDLDAAGRVQPVDPETLVEKARAVFFSPATAFVVPEAQVAPVAEAVAQLHEAFPRRSLPVIGATYLEDVFHDRRASERTVAGPVRHATRQLWRHRSAVASGTAILVLLLVLAGVVYGPIDRTPVAYQVAGEVLHLQNKEGQTVERIALGAAGLGRTDAAAAAIGVNPQTRRTDICYVTATDQTDYLTLQCRDEDTATPRWQVPLTYELDFPRSLGLTHGPFKPAALAIGDFTGDGAGEVLIAVNERRFFPGLPGLLVRYDLQTGERLGAYLHAGRILTLETADLTGDGAQEIIIGGISNAFATAFLAVLRPDALDGHAPVTNRYQPTGWTRAAELAYVQIPRTTVGERLRRYGRWVQVYRLRIHEGRQRIVARISEGGADRIEDFIHDDVAYELAFDFQLNPLRIGTSDGYDMMAARLVEEGQLASLPSVAYFEQFMQRLRYWNGTGWQRTPYFSGEPVETTPPPSMARR